MEQHTGHNTFHGNRYRKALRENAGHKKIVTKVAHGGMARGGNSWEEEERRERQQA